MPPRKLKLSKSLTNSSGFQIKSRLKYDWDAGKNPSATQILMNTHISPFTIKDATAQIL